MKNSSPYALLNPFKDTECHSYSIQSDI